MDVENKAFEYSSLFVGGFSALNFKSFNNASSNSCLLYIIHTSFRQSYCNILVCHSKCNTPVALSLQIRDEYNYGNSREN